MSAPIRGAYRRNRTGVAGITEQVIAKPEGRMHRYFIVTPHGRRFNIDTLGRPEAFRRALALRAQHEQAILNTAHRAAKEAARG